MSVFLKLLLLGSLCSFVVGADFSKKSNDELINLSGIVNPKDEFDYKQEIKKRIKEMTKEERSNFRSKLMSKQNEVYDNMKVKDFKARNKEIKDERNKRCKENKELCPSEKIHKMCGKCEMKNKENSDKSDYKMQSKNETCS